VTEVVRRRAGGGGRRAGGEELEKEEVRGEAAGETAGETAGEHEQEEVRGEDDPAVSEREEVKCVGSMEGEKEGKEETGKVVRSTSEMECCN
jgi:hypothetical protein